jgi:AAA+ superfamily predicted ATPase
MPTPDETLAGLRAALAASPDNIPLRQVLADTLLGFGRTDEAERELREAVARWPREAGIKASLARVYFQKGETSKALVVLEDLAAGDPAPAVRILYARALLRSGGRSDRERAAYQYKLAIDRDPSLADSSLADELGVAAGSGGAEGAAGPSRMRIEGRTGEPDPEGASPNDLVPLERPTVSFKDVGGMEAVKEEIRLKIIYPLLKPELYRSYGKPIGGGILMYGPPGCGKTHLARATAGEVKARFISVGISDVLAMWMGESEKNLRSLFDQARDNKPCVLFFDEVDALGASRTDMRHSAGRQLVNQFLSELDGLGPGNEGVLVLAATNAPWHIDPAFRRPGRFDRIVFVPPPDHTARAEIVRLLMTGKPADTIDADAIAKKTADFSGADLKAMVDVAIEAKLREALGAKGDGQVKAITTRDLLAAAGTLRPTCKEWFSSARNHALYANQSGLYDPILTHLKLK